ncbi:MAG: hypothetical protein AAB965_02385 [Patescibacteria group bacterium]|mgnify:CR=1 FL=1
MGIENFGKNSSLDKKLALNDLSVKDLETKLAEDARKATLAEKEKVTKQQDFDKRLGDTKQGVWPTNSEAQDLYDSMPKRQGELNQHLAEKAKARIEEKKSAAQKLKEEIEKGIEER